MNSSDSLRLIKQVVRSQGNSARRLDCLRERLESSEPKRKNKDGSLLSWFLSLIGVAHREDRHGAA